LIKHEYFRILEDCFILLKKGEKSKLINLILKGPKKKIEYSSEEEREISRKIWIMNRLWPIRDHLLEKEGKFLNELVSELGEPEHPSFSVYHYKATSGDIPIMDIEELKKKDPKEIVKLLIEDNFQFDRLKYTPRGLGFEIKKIVTMYPDKFSIIIEEINKIKRPTYLSSIFDGFRDAINSNKKFNWEGILKLCDKSLERTDLSKEEETFFDTKKSLRMSIAYLIEDGLKQDRTGIPFSLLSSSKSIILKLLSDEDPSPQDEKKNIENLHPSEYAINTVRGTAMHILLQYILKSYRAKKDKVTKLTFWKELDQEIKMALDDKLDKEKDPSIAVHSVFGVYIPNLFYICQDWFKQNIDDILPIDDNKNQYWQAAWNSYMRFGRLFKEVCIYLKHHYEKAINNIEQKDEEERSEKIDDERLGDHLIAMYFEGIENLDEKNILANFYNKSYDDLRSHIVWTICQAKIKDKEIGQADWRKIRKLWQWRMKSIKKDTEIKNYKNEVSSFSLWLKDCPENIDTTYDLLMEMILYVDDYIFLSKILEYLSVQSINFPGYSINILNEIIKNERTYNLLFYQYELPKKIIQNVIENGTDNEKAIVIDMINLFGERGEYSFKDLYYSNN
ncbi:MAG: hypothetical protein KAJ51_17050, partial [Thermoplasmata archaeon]|nr:hypothetical protein [Thermoplasmata archaeon]